MRHVISSLGRYVLKIEVFGGIGDDINDVSPTLSLSF
jgi:hypothetical protein